MSKSQLNEILLKRYLETKNTLNKNQNAELEIKFGTRGIKPITKITFDSVIKHLLSNNFYFKPESKYYLSIQSNNIRTEIVGIDNVQNYCRKNKIPDEHNFPEYNFTIKKPYTSELTKDVQSTINYDNFNYRISYSIETDLSSESDNVISLLDTWEGNKKFYRLINRHTLIHDEFPVKIDMSIVKESSRDGSERESLDIKESNIFKKNEKYEIEIEVDNAKLADIVNKYRDKEELPIFLDKILKKIIKYILGGLQETNYPISYSEQTEIINKYLQLVKARRPGEIVSVSPKDFIGPSSATLQIANISDITDENIVNIRQNYTVTDKADGDRKMLYIADNGKIYFITTLMNIQFTGAVTKNEKLFNTLMDGEHIKHDKKFKYINLYLAFDIYILDGKDIRAYEFVPLSSEVSPNKFRIPLLQKVIQSLDAILVNTTKNAPLRIDKKKFHGQNSRQTIFNSCNTILSNIEEGLYEYNTDGLIFTPTNLGVGCNSSTDVPKPYKTSWKYSLKWKPSEFNTIDFLITTKKTSTGSEFIGNLFEAGLDTKKIEQVIQYKTIILRVGFDERKHGYINPCQNIIDDKLPSVDNIETDATYKPVQFFPTNPYDPDAGITNLVLKLDKNNKKQMLSEENDIIEDNMIVEFKYDFNKDKQWRWIPLRVRYDKTAEYRSGHKNYGNAYHVAQSNWNSIHNPITVEMIRTGNSIPSILYDDDIYYNKTSSGTHTKAMRDFHNLFVKNKLIMSVSKMGDTLIDYAVGKGGDIPKWISASLSFVFGLDISRDNIENRLDGACARYLSYKRRFKIMPDALFIHGNSGVNIKNLSAQYTDKGKQITKAVFGEGSNSEEIIGKGVAKVYGKGADGFNISSIQFAIHYMFENSDTLNNFLTNIAECTKEGGYFIGTCFDGNKIFELLKDIEQNESITIFDYDRNNKLLEITKRYNKEDFPDNITCLNYGIDVFQESINKTFREYLVNYDYFISVMENYGFIPLTSDEAKSMGLKSGIGNFDELYKLMNDEIKREPNKKNAYGMAYRMTRNQKDISFLNKYFIFKKVRNIDIHDLKLASSFKVEKSSLDTSVEPESEIQVEFELSDETIPEVQETPEKISELDVIDKSDIPSISEKQSVIDSLIQHQSVKSDIKAPLQKASSQKAQSRKAPSQKASSQKAQSRKAQSQKVPTEKVPTQKIPRQKTPTL